MERVIKGLHLVSDRDTINYTKTGVFRSFKK
jgi:hypothetical protein